MASLITVAFLLLSILFFLTEQAKVSRRYTMLQKHRVSVPADFTRTLFIHITTPVITRIVSTPLTVTSGKQVSKITINHAINHDWEDIACGPCPGNHGDYCVYIADTGGNVHEASNTIYRIKEPAHLDSHVTIDIDSTLTFIWDEHNCETLMVDPHAELYVVSKVDGGHGKMVHLPSSAWGSSHRASVHDGIHLNGIHSSRNDPVGGDISPTGYEVLIKTIEAVNYYYIPDGNYLQHMTSTPLHLPYHRERQGEGIGWDPNVRGYYTLGEGSNQPIYFYKRQPSSSIIG